MWVRSLVRTVCRYPSRLNLVKGWRKVLNTCWNGVLSNTMNPNGLIVNFHLFFIARRSNILLAWHLRLVFCGRETWQWPINATLESKVHSLILFSITILVLSRNLPESYTNWKSKFLLILGQLNRALNNLAQDLRFKVWLNLFPIPSN